MKQPRPRPTVPIPPEAPEDIEGDALTEWHRIREAAAELGHPIREADRSILSVYCRTWKLHHLCYLELLKTGAVMEFSNGNQGISPHYKVFKDATRLLRTLLADLGCTPASRDFDAKTIDTAAPVAELDLD
jgi:P27 family predicted phage terminase small subunit